MFGSPNRVTQNHLKMGMFMVNDHCLQVREWAKLFLLNFQETSPKNIL